MYFVVVEEAMFCNLLQNMRQKYYSCPRSGINLPTFPIKLDNKGFLRKLSGEILYLFNVGNSNANP